MNDMISFNSENIANYIMFKLDKLDNKFTLEELNNITELVVDFEEENNNVFEQIKCLSNLSDLTLKNAYVYDDDFKYLLSFKKLDIISFEKCSFENADLIGSLNVNELELINCNINNYNFIGIMKQLSSLTINNGIIDTCKLNILKDLVYLNISYSKIMDIDEKMELNNIEQLYIDNTNIINLSFINELSNINLLSIDEKQYEKNKELVNNLINKGVIVKNESMIEFGGDTDEV